MPVLLILAFHASLQICHKYIHSPKGFSAGKGTFARRLVVWYTF